MRYEDIPAYNASLLKRVNISLRHARHYLQYGLAETMALIEGTMFDMRVFDPEKYNNTYASSDLDLRTKAGKAWKEEMAATGKIIVSAKQMAKVGDMWYALAEHPIARRWFFEDVPEGDRMTQIQLHAELPALGANIKGIPDLVVCIDGERWLIDLKSTSNPYPRRFASDMATFGYDIQMALYADLCAANGIHIDRVGICAVDKGVVHDVICYELTEDAVLFHGREKYTRAIQLLQTAEKTDRWPGFAENEIIPLHLPEYAYSDDIELTMDGEVVG